MAGILFVCTGNASRSVMAAAVLHALAPGWPVASAGTHSVEGQPMGWRTRRALEAGGFHADGHRSHQATAADLAAADAVAVFESFQLDWVRRELPAVAGRATSLRRLAATLPPPGPGAGDLAGRLAPLDLARVRFEPDEEVVDPGGGELDDYVACAAEIVPLVTALARRLGPPPAG